MCDKCNDTIRKLEDEVKVAQDKLVQGLYDRIFCPLNEDNIRKYNPNDTKTTTTETPINPSTECIHQFCDVYDYVESIPEEIIERCSRYTLNGNIECIPDILKEAKLTTKTYRLSYCKICGYTLYTE